MSLIIIAVAAFGASCLTFFSGFGLGTILMPVFALFFPLESAIALTAIVHFLNNALKLALLWKQANWGIVLRFGLPAFLAAVIGAEFLEMLQSMPPIIEYHSGEKVMTITFVKLVIA